MVLRVKLFAFKLFLDVSADIYFRTSESSDTRVFVWDKWVFENDALVWKGQFLFWPIAGMKFSI